MATVQEILDRALAMSVANDPGHIIAPLEAVIVVRRVLRELYVRARGIDPLFFSTPIDVNPAGGAWAIPLTAAGVVLIQTAGIATGQGGPALAPGLEVTIVPLDEKEDSAFPPRVYRVGRKYFTVGKEGDPSPTLDKLTLYVPDAAPVSGITLVGHTLPADWPTEFEDLVAVQLAKYCSLKDKARGDMTALEAELTKALALFDSYIADFEGGGVVSGFTESSTR